MSAQKIKPETTEKEDSYQFARIGLVFVLLGLFLGLFLWATGVIGTTKSRNINTRSEACLQICEKYGHEWSDWNNLRPLLAFENGKIYPDRWIWVRHCSTCKKEETKESWSATNTEVTKPMHDCAVEVANKKIEALRKEFNAKIDKKQDKEPEIISTSMTNWSSCYTIFTNTNCIHNETTQTR